MSELNILSKEERRSFDKIPTLTREERQLYFRLDQPTKAYVSNLKNPINRIGFVLQLGYFKAMAKFYPVTAFKKRDINYVKKMLGIKDNTLMSFSEYTSTTYYRHQERIQSSLGWQAYNSDAAQRLQDHANHQAGLQRKPKRMLGLLIDFCWKHQLTIPTYTELAEIVTIGFLTFEKTMVSELTMNLTETAQQVLDDLLDYQGGVLGT